MSRVTLADIAAEVGVSVSTVQRALSASGELSPSTRRAILATADRLGYTRGADPRGRPRRTPPRHFDLVLGLAYDSWAAEVIAGAREAATELAFDLILTAEEFGSPRADWPERIIERGSSGVIAGLIQPTRTQLRRLAAADIDIVLLDPWSSDAVDVRARIGTTDAEGAAEAAAHLADAGAETFCVVVGTPAYRFGRARTEGFVRTLESIRPHAHVGVVSTNWTAEGARAVVTPTLREARAAGQRIGVFACTDDMAGGVYLAASDERLRIPEDVLVVGFDDVLTEQRLSPPLTSVHQPIREMAAAGVEILAGARDDAHGEIVEMPTYLVVRASTQ